MTNFGRPMDRQPDRFPGPTSTPALPQPLTPNKPFVRRSPDSSPASVERPAGPQTAPEFVRLQPAANSTPADKGGQPGRPPEQTASDRPETPDPSANVTSHLSATAVTGEVAQPSHPEAGPPKGEDSPDALPNEVHETEKRPFTVVEIGAGRSPVLMDTEAPDVRKLYEEGGKYVAVDPLPRDLQTGQRTAEHYIEEHAQPDATIDTEFHEAHIAPGTPLPEGLTPGSADRVVVGNVLTHPRVAENPEQCQAIADAVAELLALGGEAVIIGTATPSVFPRDRVTELMRSVGLEHVGPDDVSLHYPQGYRDDIPGAAYAERYRRRQEPTASPEGGDNPQESLLP